MTSHAEDVGFFHHAARRGIDIFRGVGETITAAGDEAQLVIDGPARTNMLFKRFPGEAYTLPMGETCIPVHYYNSRLIQVAVLVQWDYVNDYAQRFGLHAVRYGDCGLVLLMIARHKASSLGEYCEYLYSIHVSRKRRGNLCALPSLASISAFNPLGIEDGDGLLIGEVSVTEQNTSFPNAKDVGVFAYGLNKTIGQIDVAQREISMTIQSGKISSKVHDIGIPVPVAISTLCFTTGTDEKASSQFQFEIRSWLKPACIKDFIVQPGEDDPHGLMALLKEGRVLGGLDGSKAQAILGKPTVRA